MLHTWKIKLFAGLPERLGTSQIIVESEAGQMTANALKSAIILQYPEHANLLQICFLAQNHAYAPDEETLSSEDELAMLPPVSGGEEAPSKRAAAKEQEPERYVITPHAIIADEVLAKVIVKENGASLAFVGTTREFTEGKRTVKLSYEAYDPMAIATMKQIGDEIAARWEGALCAISHRVGIVELAETSVVIAVSSPHRAACYEASRYAIERLKQIVPIWKQEIWEDGSEWKGHQLGSWNPLGHIQE
ncbi:molybdenum cofactor biosynthesis protein MoaE [Paenibacillus sp. HB172176]|uniref:molybdenum cofactor biosynthesis protein n=1 Tax=Paenibacillus sp. HB172176 TaxID=2493690 RepID=UPI00143B9D22|nr:molybdenum cofactor biosynthesis protein MoaE [Paenibacillus sp. HB172176]